MEHEQLLSVGIDVGTSTTQCVFSRLTLTNVAPAFSLPRVVMTDKTVLFRGPLRLTPLSGPDRIDAAALRSMVEADYRAAGVLPRNIRCGAIIMTGETARKQNARDVSAALSSLAGDFVVATAGPDLESILAGYGSGAAALSAAKRVDVLNLDIGGGTTNMCLLRAGEPAATGNLDIGGRLIRFEPGSTTVLSYSGRIAPLAEDVGVTLRAGRRLEEEELRRLAGRMAAVIEEAVNKRPRTPLYEKLVLEHGLDADVHADVYTFSGGVGSCVYGAEDGGLAFDDVGVRLAAALRGTACFREGRVLRPAEIQQATVIGAGAYSMTVSGSTIEYADSVLPVRGLPVAKIRFARPEDIPTLAEQAAQQRRVIGGDCALGFRGLESPTFRQIEAAAEQLAAALSAWPVRVVMVESDMAKALGQALKRRLPEKPLICLDGVPLKHGDTVDIGTPLAGGRVLPVVVKTLAFAGG